MSRLPAVTGLLVATIAGCATPPPAADGDVTGGVSLEMLVARPGNGYALYRVTPDGALSFAGGMNAHRGRFTWTGPMTGAEVDHLLSLLAEDDLFAAGKSSPASDDGWSYTLAVERPDGRRKAALRGEASAARPLYDLLETAAGRRLDVFLDTLPQPGEQR